MPSSTFDYTKIQKVEFKTGQCNIGITDYVPGKNLLITDVPAEAGSMLGGLSLAQYFTNGPVLSSLKPRVYIEYTTPVSAGAGLDQAKYNGRIELREFA
jgi:hypothetical protein